MARALLLPADPEEWPTEKRIILDEADSLQVRVTQGGQPVEGAVVDHYGLTPGGTPAGDGAFTESHLRRYLQRSGRTDREGRVLLGAFPGEQVLVAHKEGQRSLRWRGRTGPVQLELEGEFSMLGDLSLPTWEHLNYEGERRITVSAERNGVWLDLASLRDVDGGEWGPLNLPLGAEIDRYRVRLEGSPIIPREVSIPPPGMGDVVRVDLEAELGEWIRFEPMDMNRKRIMNAEVTAYFLNEDGVSWNRVTRRAGADGFIWAWSFPPGMVHGEVRAEGYSPTTFSGVHVPMSLKYTVGVYLDRLGEPLRGRCVHAGQPVEDFHVVFWVPGRAENRHTRSFSDREDGTFELRDVPEGEIRVTAYNRQLVAHGAVPVDSADGEEVVIELEAPLERSGLVVDARTKEPVPDASVQLFVKSGLERAGPWGNPFPVGEDGRFRIRGFVPGENFLVLRAPGYGELLTKVFITEEKEDLGTFRLLRPVTVVMSLVSEEPLDFSQFSLYGAHGVAALPDRKFDEDGFVVYEDVPAGSYFLTLRHPDYSQEIIPLEARAGEEAYLEKRLDGALDVEVQLIPETEIGRVAGVRATYRSSEGQDTEWIVGMIPGNGKIRFEGVDAESANIEAVDAVGRSMGEVTVAATGSKVEVDLDLTGEATLLRVLSAAGQPLGNVFVTVNDPTGRTSNRVGMTDAGGEVRFMGVREGSWVVDLRHADEGGHYGIPVEGRELIELTLEADASLTFEVGDGEEALEGVLCRLMGPDGRILGLPFESDVKGKVTIDKISRGSYTVRATREDCWEARFEAATETAGLVGQVRRLGSLRFRAQDVNGLGIQGIRPRITSLEFGDTIQAWIEAGQVKAEAQSTDNKGELVFEGVPNGTYRWESSGKRGTVSVPAKGTGKAILTVE